MRSIADKSILKSGARLDNVSVILLDVNLTYVEAISWQRAVTMMSKGSVNVLASYSQELPDGTSQEVRIRSGVNSRTGVRLDIPLPYIVSLVEYVYDPYAAFLKSNSEIATKRAILSRDEYTCAYCEKKADTVDHIIPQSRGGGNTWTNLVAACKPCNNKKADRTPEEAGMKLLWEPQKYDGGAQDLQKEIYDFLMQESGAS